MPKTKKPVAKSPQSAPDVDAQLTAQQSQIDTLTTKLFAEKKLDRRLYKIIAGLCILCLGIGIGMGLQYFDVLGRLENSTRDLVGLEQKLDQTESDLVAEAEANQEKTLLLAQATEENIALKQEATERAATEAQAELDAQAEAEAASRRFVTADKRESNLPGLNTRTEPCGPAASEYRVWGTGGEVLAGPERPGPCLDGDYEWYQVKWNDGVTGWSIANYLTFSGEKQLSTTGYLTGYSPYGYDSRNETRLAPTVCATNQADGISYCNAELNAENSTYKLLVPAGNYIVSGSFRYRDYRSGNIVRQDTLYTQFTACGYSPECYDQPGRDNAAVVQVTPGDAVVGVSLWAF